MEMLEKQSYVKWMRGLQQRVKEAQAKEEQAHNEDGQMYPRWLREAP